MRDLRVVPAVMSSALCVGLLAARWGHTGTPAFLFLVWNLFLAWLPWLIAVPLANLATTGWRGWTVLPLFGAWLVFLPNAPYLVTDLIHLRPRAGAPLWFDAGMLFAFGWTGCLLGYLSLTAVHGIVETWVGRAAGWLFVGAVCALSGFGIYLGRFPRWNSWDVVTRPEQLLRDMSDRLTNPTAHPRTFGVTVFFALVVIAGYAAFADRRPAAHLRITASSRGAERGKAPTC